MINAVSETFKRGMIDFTAFTYLLTFFVCLYGFTLFILWWKHHGKATSVYMIVAFLFLTNSFNAIIELHSRFMQNLGLLQRAMEFRQTTLWAWREVPELFLLTWLVLMMTRRWINNSKRVVKHD